MALTLTHVLAWAPVALLLLNGASFRVYSRTPRLVLPHAIASTKDRDARIDVPPRGIPGGWIGASGLFVLLAARAGRLRAHWQLIPDHPAVHWGLDVQLDLWAARSLSTVYSPPILVPTTLLAMTQLLQDIAHWMRPIYADGLKRRQESRVRRTSSLMRLAIESSIAVLFSSPAIRPALPAALRHPSAVIALTPRADRNCSDRRTDVAHAVAGTPLNNPVPNHASTQTRISGWN